MQDSVKNIVVSKLLLFKALFLGDSCWQEGYYYKMMVYM